MIQGWKMMERETGIEPVTSSLGSWRSTAELLPLGCHDSSSRHQSRNSGALFREAGVERLDFQEHAGRESQTGTSRGECSLATPGWFCT